MKKILVLAVAVIVIVYLTYSYLTDSPEKRVKECIRQAAAAVEKGNTAALMALVSQDYSDDLGLDFFMLTGVAMRSLNRYKDAQIKVSNLKIELFGKEAQATLAVRAEATDAYTIKTDGSIPERPSYYKERILVRFKADGKRFLISGSSGINPKEWGVDF